MISPPAHGGRTLLILLSLLLASTLMWGPLATPARAEPLAVTISIDGITPDYLTDDDELVFTGTITNNGPVEIHSLTVWWRMRVAPLTPETYETWLSQTDEIEPLTLARYDLPEALPAGRTHEFTMVIPPESSPFDSASVTGVRGVELVLTGRDEENDLFTVRDRSAITWWAHDNPAPTTYAVPLTPTEQEWQEALDRGVPVADVARERILGIIDELSEQPVQWGVDAALLDSVPAGRGRLLTHIPDELSPDEPFDPLEWPESASAQDIAAALHEHPGVGAALPLGWASPDHHALLEGGEAGQGIHALNLTSAQTILDGAGIDQHSTTLWSLAPLTRGNLTKLDARLTRVILPPVPGGAHTQPPNLTTAAYAPVAELSRLIGAGTDPHDLLIRSLLYGIRQEPLLVTAPADLTPESARTLSEDLAVLRELPWLTFGALAPVGDRVSIPSPTPEPSSLTPHDVSELANGTARGMQIAGISQAPEQMESIVRSSAFLASSYVWGQENSPQRDLVDLIAGLSGSTYLTIERPSTINLISQGGQMPVSIENSGVLRLRPTVVVEPSDPRLVIEEAVLADLPPDHVSTVLIPIRGVANGNVVSTIHLLDANGADIAEPQTFVVRVRADWETTGMAIIAGVVVLAFLFGLFRSIKRAPDRTREA